MIILLTNSAMMHLLQVRSNRDSYRLLLVLNCETSSSSCSYLATVVIFLQEVFDGIGEKYDGPTSADVLSHIWKHISWTLDTETCLHGFKSVYHCNIVISVCCGHLQISGPSL